MAQRNAAFGIIGGTTGIAGQIQAAANQFNSASMALDHSADGAGDNLDPATQSQLARLNQLSPQQQQLVWAGSAPQTGSLDAWKSQLAQDQAIMEQDNASSPAPILKVTLSDNAKKALASGSITTGTTSTTASSSGSTDANAKALQTLTEKPADTSADVGLAVLQNAAQAKAASDAQSTSDNTANGSASSSSASSTTTTNNPTKPYKAGDRLSVKA